WSQLELAENVYTGGPGSGQGFDMVDQHIAACQFAGLQYILHYEDRAFGNPRAGAKSYGILPPYFDSLVCGDGAPGYVSYNPPIGTLLVMSVKALDPVVTALAMALDAAYGARYDSNPTF